MGLFDAFRRKQKGIPGDADLPDELRCRCTHYQLAHVALRTVAFDDPLFFVGVLASPDAQRFLAHVLSKVRDVCKDEEPLADFSVEELNVHRCRANSFPCVIIEMPPPRATAEAFYVAAVLLADPEEGLPSADVKLRYLTLEKGFALGGPPRTVLCEWTSDEKGISHVNYGDGPDPNVAAFLARIESMV